MIKLVDKKPDGTSYFIADTDADVANLPTDVSVGSSCFVIGDGSGSKAYMINNSQTWVKI